MSAYLTSECRPFSNAMTTTLTKLRVGHYVSFRLTKDEWSREGLVLYISDEGIVRVVERNKALHEITLKQIERILLWQT